MRRPHVRPYRRAKVGRKAQLSPRQLEVLELVACGLSARAVAAQLGLSPRTVECHLRVAREKLGVPTTLAAVAHLIRPPIPKWAASVADAELLALVGFLGEGVTVREAAARLQLSRRTAHRRLAAARGALGVLTTSELVRALTSRRGVAQAAPSDERERLSGGVDSELPAHAAEQAIE